MLDYSNYFYWLADLSVTDSLVRAQILDTVETGREGRRQRAVKEEIKLSKREFHFHSSERCLTITTSLCSTLVVYVNRTACSRAAANSATANSKLRKTFVINFSLTLLFRCQNKTK